MFGGGRAKKCKLRGMHSIVLVVEVASFGGEGCVLDKTVFESYFV